MLLSIITINYNNADGLRKTLESVRSQTSKNYEHIIVDGGSTDGSVDVIHEFLQDEEYAEHVTFWCSEKDKGIFVLVKTSNPSSGELQDMKLDTDETVYEHMGRMCESWGEELMGKYGYSAVGAVVGATYPEQLKEMRAKLPHTFFLVPGYGAQGGGAGVYKQPQHRRARNCPARPTAATPLSRRQSASPPAPLKHSQSVKSGAGFAIFP